MVGLEAQGDGVVQLMVGVTQFVVVVVIVGQRLRRFVIDGIYHLGLRLVGEVAGVLRAAVNVGVALVDGFLVVGCPLAAL